MKITAFLTESAGGELTPRSISIPELQPDEILVRITHCGLCHSDLHLIDDDFGFSKFPLVPGHEVVGVVEEVGTNVVAHAPGARVGIGWQADSCGHCEWCHDYQENLCADRTATCVGRNGGFATYIVVKAHFAASIPNALASEHAAPLLCAGLTVFSPLQRYNVKKGTKVGIIGMGGLGHLAIQFAHKMGAEVTLFSSSVAKTEAAIQFGACHIIDSRDLEALKAAYESQDLILSTVTADLDWKAYVNALRPNGILCFLGLTAENLNISPMNLTHNQKTVTGSATGGMRTMQDMLDTAAIHGIKPMVEILPMQEINTALERLKRNDVKYRFVLTN